MGMEHELARVAERRLDHRPFPLTQHRSERLVLITERCCLWTVASLLEARKPLGEKPSLTYALCVARAIHHIASKGLAHRNLNPRLLSLGEYEGCRLATFSNVITADEYAGLKGKLHQDADYVAPEQVGGHEPVGARTPCYQIGALLFHMLAGSPRALSSSATTGRLRTSSQCGLQDHGVSGLAQVG